MFAQFSSFIAVLFFVLSLAFSASARLHHLKEVENKKQSASICDHLIEYYIETWHTHQELATEIQTGGYWPPAVLEARLNLLEQLNDYLFNTARLMQKHNCVLPDDALEKTQE